ncbi:MAG TPA: hypothetical protein VFW98_01135 [Gemmatimonadaceae bacterium]|nr:hypothetical protein [Gemmatimonadaceae bacterium]
MKRFIRVLCMAACVPALGACYTYTVVPVTTATAGSGVRVRITGAEADRLGDVLGRDQDRVVEGDLVAPPNDGNLLLSLPSSTAQEDGSVTRTFQRVVVPRNAIVTFEVRRLDRWKTGGLAALAATVLGVVAVEAFTNEQTPPGSAKPNPNK